MARINFSKKKIVILFALLLFLVSVIALAFYSVSLRSDFSKERNYPNYIKGVWTPRVEEYSLIARDMERMKSDNLNVISISARINSTVLFQRKLILSIVKAAKKNELAVHLVPSVFGGGTPDSKAISDTKLKSFIPKVIEWAEFAEEYGIEYFTPVNEADLNFCTDRAIPWHAELLPEIRKVYTGKIFTKWIDCNQKVCTKSGNFECGSEVFLEKIRASQGYDGVIFDIFAPVGGKTFEEFYVDLEEKVKVSSEEAHKLNLEILIGEFGVATMRSKEGEGMMPGPVVSIEEQLEFTAKFIDIVKPHYDGLIYGAWTMPDYGMKDKPVEKVIREKFK